MPNSAMNRNDTKTYSGIMDCQAKCDNCKWECFTRNALGLAKIHHNRTGHTVQIESVIGVTYTLAGSNYEKGWNDIHQKKLETEAKNQ